MSEKPKAKKVKTLEGNDESDVIFHKFEDKAFIDVKKFWAKLKRKRKPKSTSFWSIRIQSKWSKCKKARRSKGSCS